MMMILKVIILNKETLTFIDIEIYCVNWI